MLLFYVNQSLSVRNRRGNVNVHPAVFKTLPVSCRLEFTHSRTFKKRIEQRIKQNYVRMWAHAEKSIINFQSVWKSHKDNDGKLMLDLWLYFMVYVCTCRFVQQTNFNLAMRQFIYLYNLSWYCKFMTVCIQEIFHAALHKHK